jgi:itaconate CoA-transferase
MHSFGNHAYSNLVTNGRPGAMPLDGIVVVSCEQAVAAPLATRHLADLGARVIKVEREGAGDFARGYDETVQGLSSHFVWLNRSKESLALDLKQPEAQVTMLRLLERADVFVQNFAPGAAERLGLGAAALRQRFPRLITCSISGYGSSGPYRDAKAYDLLIQAEAGLLSVTGTEEHPAKSGIPAADIGAGMYAFSGVLAALYERERTGEGAELEVSLFDALTEWMGFPLYYTGYGGQPPRRTGTAHAAIAPYGAFAAGDGSEVVLGVQNEREWQAFCARVLRRAELAEDPRFDSGSRRVANRAALHKEIDAVFRALTGEEVTARLAEARVAHARRREVSEVLEHPQLAARDRWTEVDSEVGPLWALLPPIGFAGRAPRMDRIPTVGEHNEEILRWLGDGHENVGR